ncbi:hypothetical protein WJX81_004736 [Elliptochloris bilobata]|uniref:Serine incorporator n=1 Tax=Elliptochloris bilobata TaxID=381761 RepID=A0AAW1RPD4_9CHLO
MFAFTWVGSALASCAATCACHACTFASKEVMRRSARLAYCALFMLAMVLAWILRDFAKPLIDKLPWIVHAGGGDPSERWYGQQAVYRVSLGNFLFFGLMALAMVGVRLKSDKRDQYLQHGGWFVKIALWLLFNVLAFFLPVGMVNAYGWVARAGSALFLCVQILMLLDFMVSWNDAWVDQEDNRLLWALLGITAGAYVGVVVIAGLLFYFFNPAGAGDCSLNISIVATTLVLALLVSAVSMSPYARNGSLFPAAVVSLYCSYLAYSALVSEPHDYACNGVGRKLTAASASTLVAGMALALLAVVWSALRAGSNTALFRLGLDEAGAVGGAGGASQPLVDDEEGRAFVQEEGTSAGLDGAARMTRGARTANEASAAELAPVTYNYAFFHLIFALASTYIAMLMTGWGTGADEKDFVDVGWGSVGVKLATQWATAGAYAWMLLAPALMPEREFL